MKLIKQTTLVYQQGKSDKVYEVDLCEVGQDRYVVNFRYGRRGTNLREGAKTVSPVSRAEADKIFTQLVASKIRRGYQEATDQPAEGASAAPLTRSRPTRAVADARQQAILDRLAEAIRPGSVKKPSKSWPLERVIWRAGELKIEAATPLLIDLIGSGDALRDYCLAWALGWCGVGDNNSAISALGRLYGDAAAPDAVRRIATEALLKLSDAATKAEFQADIIANLPPVLHELGRNGPANDFLAALKTYLEIKDNERFTVLDTIYLIDNEHVRPALLTILRTAPLRPNYFRSLRHIFKAAEYRRDAEVFGILAHHFEKIRAMFSNTYYPLDKDWSWSQGVYAEGKGYVWDARKEIQSDSSQIAYGSRTRTYLRRRVWRTLKRLGELDDGDYVKMAVGVLLPYTDADAQPIQESRFYDYQLRRYRSTYWDAYAGYWVFNHILYTHSLRYRPKVQSMAWSCHPTYKPGDPVPERREEAFPKLWEARPAGLLHLISDSDCEPVHQFAINALRDCQAFCAELDVAAIIMILSRPYAVTAGFGFELAKAHYQPYNPDRDLVLAVVNCALETARVQAQQWIDEYRNHFLADSDFIIGLATSPYADTRQFARTLLRSAIMDDITAKALIARLIAYLLTLDVDQAELAKDMAETVLQSFGRQVRSLGMTVVYDLLAHPLPAVQGLGGNILLNHDLRADDLPEGIITALIASPYETIRGIGLKLFGQLADKTLFNQETLIVILARHELADIRNAIRPVIRRLSQADPAFAARLGTLFSQILLEPEPAEAEANRHAIQTSLMRLLAEDLGEGWMLVAPSEMIWRLIHASSAAAQELGGILIAFKVQADQEWSAQVETEQIIELSDHEVHAVRQAAQRIFMQVIGRFQQAANPGHHLQEIGAAVRLLDAKWDDARQFWFETFQTHFGAADFSPGILVSICDSVREDVQAFGRRLITTYFEAEAGQDYLLKLSEHPSVDLQLFATNFLERYATDNPARLEELKPYFISVLSRVNKARVAKDRVMLFLLAEAQKSEAAARIVAEILTRQSVTLSIGDKGAAIEAMLKIHQYYPQVPLPIQVKEPEVRYAV